MCAVSLDRCPDHPMETHQGEDGRGIYLPATSCFSLINICPRDTYSLGLSGSSSGFQFCHWGEATVHTAQSFIWVQRRKQWKFGWVWCNGLWEPSACGCLHGCTGQASQGREAGKPAGGFGRKYLPQRLRLCIKRVGDPELVGTKYIQESVFTDPTPQTCFAPHMISPLTTNSHMLRTRLLLVFPRREVQVQCPCRLYSKKSRSTQLALFYIVDPSSGQPSDFFLNIAKRTFWHFHRVYYRPASGNHPR